MENSNVRENKDIKIPGYICICYILCMVCGIAYSVTSVSALGYLATLIAMYVVVKADKSEVFLFLFGCQFLRAVIRVNLGFTNLDFLMFAYAVWFLRFFVFERKMKAIELIPLFLLVWDILISFFRGVTKIGDNFLWTMSLLMLLTTILDDDYPCDDEENKVLSPDNMIFIFCISTWCVCLINIATEYIKYGQTLIPSMYGSYINGSYFSFGKAYDSLAGGNEIALYTILAVSLCFIMLVENRTKHRIFYIISIIAFSYFGMMCIARAFYIELIIFIALFILSQIKKPLRFLMILLLLVAVVLLAYNYAYDYLAPFFKAVQIRFEQGNLSRTELLDSARALLSSDLGVLFFGGGSYYPDIYGFTAHNLFYDVLVSLGIIGTLFYVIVCLVPEIQYIIKSGRFNLEYFIPIIMLFSYKMISGSTRDVYFYFIFAVLLIFYRKMKVGEDKLE